MPKKGGKGKNKNKGGKAGGAAAAAATKKVADTQNPVTPSQEVEETVATGEGEAGGVVAEPVEAVAAAPATTIPDATTEIPSAAPPASTEEAKEILQNAVDKAETGPADKAELIDGEVAGAAGLPTTDKNLKLTPETLTSSVGPETSLPERPKETAVDVHDTHAKRPYESSLTAKDDELPHKIAKVDDTVTAAGATSGHVAETGSLAKKPEVPAETSSVQPQIVPGLGADPNDRVSTVLNVPGLSSVEDKSTIPSTTGTSAVAASSTSELKGAEDIAPTGAPTTVTTADTAKESKDFKTPKAKDETAPLTTATPAVVDEPKAPSTTELTTAGTATSAPPPPSEPVLKVPSSIHDGPDSKVTSGKKAATQAVSNVEQNAQGAPDNTHGAAKTMPEESKPAAEVQEGTAAVKDQLPAESQPAAKQTQEAGAGVAKQPEEIKKPEEAKTKAPQAVQDARENGAAAAKKPEELKPEDIKKPEEAKTKEPQATHDAQTGAASQPEEGKSFADQAKETAQTEANKAQDQAEDKAKAEAAKLEKRKSGLFGWLKRKLKGEKA
ncbi:uncharacterized protein BDW43DRAFT_273724 [Aspergillus alliaceus]|uniref:uncharacterized protein n=1 Tax=Petromyces alliaceus TaxID=209559 RepID=UPI0012A73725|nr:uncharacterized protein BDW43DRAFT_273724 [Aspergillus alliaceus]KAB8234281.1 hypothetical protein BDW43DRAFT_273724 [Aspergillus alliaceus]